ncbi:hypothetical protein ANCDUO_23633 [Ancylostoma duodenale]|uniref:Uncharacterized protein n=1 Tax=Ancylostoma duodenale TaxID=51022 RepID=A0A0C2FNA7_9BILA|nr:hypothetical protein ANCDUO_23633 [Ancylostoma duodenale]
MEATRAETKPVWVYVIFRKNHCSGHEKMTVNISFDGPIFWNRQVAYIYCCSCHFDEHEFIYLRELDLEKINRATVVDLANHNTLKKVWGRII